MLRLKLNLRDVVACARAVADAAPNPMFLLDKNRRVLAVNRALLDRFNVTARGAEKPLAESCGGVWNTPEVAAFLADAASGAQGGAALVSARCTVAGRVFRLTNHTVPRSGARLPLLLVSATDVSASEASTTEPSPVQLENERIATVLQRALLFEPKEDAFTGLSVRTVYTVASETALVGGDFWDTFATNHGHVAFVLGDVIGHGLESAAFSAELKFAMRGYIREHIDPAPVLFHMNRFLYQSNRLFREGINTEGSDAPFCLILAVVERETGIVNLAMAGMAPAVLVRKSGKTEQVGAVGMPLGIEPHEVYPQTDIQMYPGDTLILSTDGVTEARRGREFLDTEGLEKLASAAVGGTLKDMADAILAGAQSFAGGRLKDDASLVLVRRTETSPVLAEWHAIP